MMPRKYQKRKFNDAGLDELHRSDPDKVYSLGEIAEAAQVPRQTVYLIEQRAMRKIRDEFERRGIDVDNADAIDFTVEGFGLEIS